MKLKVNRQLSAGQYRVKFEVSDFSPEEVSKMSSFGVPSVQVRVNTSQGQTNLVVQLTKLNSVNDGVFNTEQEALSYERQVTEQIQAAILRIRNSKDEFTSTREVDL
jgi:5-hydroxyisourate hydrolase-like protein (transthyretin family)